MNVTSLLMSVVLVAVILIGCNTNERAIAVLQTQVHGLSTRLDSLLIEHESLKSELQSIKSEQSLNEFLRGLDEVAYLTPGEEGYSVVKSDIGPITVSLKDVKPYANGSRITLQFGNILNATITGVKAKLEWGSVDAKGIPKNETQKSREITFRKSLSSGSWTKISVVLERVPPSDLGFVRVRELKHTGIILLQE
jgi:outer membrane murein-binding lipoprotein Lpp